MRSKTLIILDWDDTLFPTTWVTGNNMNLSNKDTRLNHQITFAELDNILYDFLSKCIKLGNVIIITNASYNWIVVSMSVLPNTTRLVSNNIKILSARDMYQNVTIMNKWKQLAFEKEAMEFFKGNLDLHNIISVGDADYEYYALIQFYDWKKIKPKKRLLKTIKLLSIPSYYSLIDQILVLSTCIDKVCNKKKHIDLHFKNLNA